MQERIYARRSQPEAAPALPSLNNFNFFFHQSIQFINKVMYLLFGGVDLALEDGFVVGGFG